MFKSNILIPFLSTLTEHSSRDSFFIDKTHYSYQNFSMRIAAIMRSLADKNDETEIGIMDDGSLDSYASIFAVWFSGKAYVSLNPDLPAARNETIISRVKIKTILSQNNTESLAVTDANSSLSYIQKIAHEQNYENQLAYIFFTSGSTGTPKGVKISKSNVASFIASFWDLGYELDETDKCLQMFDLTFDLSVFSYLAPLIKGAEVFPVPKNEVKYSYIFFLMDQMGLTYTLMVPSILNYLRPYFDEIDCSQIKYSLFCGEALKEDIAMEWSKCIPKAQIINVYGPTENTIFCTSYEVTTKQQNKVHNGVLSIGSSMRDTFAVVFNQDNSLSEIDQVGELCLAGNQLTPGYFKNEELNENLFFEVDYKGKTRTFYRTGDQCILRKDLNIDYVGRVDFQTQIQGFRVELSEIEHYISLFNEIKATTIALAVPTKNGNLEVVVAFEHSPFPTENIDLYLKDKLPGYMTPKRYEFINVFPLNINGKIDRLKLTKITSIQ